MKLPKWRIPIRLPARGRIGSLYAEKDYLQAYAEHTDVRVGRDRHEAVGGRWEEIGRLQFDFMVRRGLQPDHRMLDIGCGTLRGGRHLIRYLNPGNYTGIDISPKAIEGAEQLVKDEDLVDKRPRLLVNEGKDLRFERFAGESFDYLLAQSVFTHLKEDHIEECFQHVGNVMNDSSSFFFTFNQSFFFVQVGFKTFWYPLWVMEELAERYGFDLEDCSKDYPHPRRQRMIRLTRAAGGGGRDQGA